MSQESRDVETVIREDIIRVDPRFELDAYRFTYRALDFAQRFYQRDPKSREVKERHVSGKELLEGIRHYALREFGPMAPAVFRTWGVQSTDDFGEIVFNLVEKGLLRKTSEDTRADFAGVYDFDKAFSGPLHINLS